MSLVAAGSHRGRAVADVLIDAKRSGMPLDDVVVDPGYSLLDPGTMHDKLAAAVSTKPSGSQITNAVPAPFRATLF
jgi:hypothetical protein